MQQTTKRLSSTLFALLLLAIAAIAFFELVQPEYATLSALKGQAVSEQQLLASEQNIVVQAKGILGSYQGASSSTQALNLAMPIGADNAGAIAQIYGLATNSSLVMQSLGISLQAASQSPQSTAVASAAALVKPKGSVTFQIVAMGTYEALQTFLKGLESNVRVFDVTGLSIRPMNVVTSSGVSQASTQDLYNYTITAVAYYQSS